MGGDAKTKELQEKLREANKENKDLANRNKQLEKELRVAEKSGGGGGIDEACRIFTVNVDIRSKMGFEHWV